MTTLKQALEQFIDETRIGIYGTATARAATTITDAPNLANSNWTSGRLKGWWIQIPVDSATVTGVRPATTLTAAGVLSQGGAVWGTTGDTPYYRLTQKDWHPTRDLLPLANRALKKAWEWWRGPLTMVPDGDMQAVAAWTGTNCTTSKSTTRAWGAAIKSARGLNTSANGYSASTAFETEPGRAFRFTVKAFAAVGTPYISVYDASGTLIVSVTASPTVLNTWQDVQVSGVFPYSANGGTATVRLGGVESTADIYWGEAVLVPEMQTRMALPTWLTEWKTEQGEDALRVYRSMNRLGTIGSWPARAYDLQQISPGDYQINQNPSSLNPLDIEFRRNTFQTGFPIIVEARRPFASFGAVSADADTSAITLDHWVKAMKDLAARERSLTDRLPLWEAEFNLWQKREASKLETPVFDDRGLSYQVLG